MGFKTDGSSHRCGIHGEFSLIHMINTNPIFSCVREKLGKLEHRGGTKTTVDAESDKGVRISIKTKHSNSGSFDWLNKSYVYENDGSKELLEDIKKYYKMYKDEKDTRFMINKLSNILLKQIDVKKYLEHIIEGNCDYICINFVQRKRFIMFHKSELSRLFSECETKVKPNKMYTSCTIPGSRSLRIRLVLNNGVRSILKNGSYLCVKIQQDRPDLLERYLNNPIVIDY